MSTIIYEYGLMTVGSFLAAAGILIFVKPMLIPMGGVGGLSLLANYIWGLPVGIVTILLNIPLLAFGYKSMGKEFFVKTVYTIVVTSVLMDVITFFPVYEGEVLVAAIFGGLISGVGFGLVIKAGGTSGGSDVIGKYLYRKKSIPLGTTGMVVNVGILALSALVLKSFESLLYGVILTYVISMAMDNIIYGGDVQKNAFIITSKPKEVSDAIMHATPHSVTALQGKGMYTGEDRMVLMCVVRRNETNLVKKIISDVDEGAFMLLSDVNEVLGKGFKKMGID